MAVKNMAASVLTRLKNQSKEEGIPFQMVLQLFAQEEFLRKLSLSQYADNLILKGGMFLSMKYVGQKAHESKEIKPVTTALIREFNKKYSSVLCKDIKPQSFDPKLRCKYTIETACDILEAVIAEYEKNKETD